ATLAWSLAETGLDPWGLEVRLLTPGLLVLALFLLAPVARWIRIVVAFVAAGMAVGAVAWIFLADAPPAIKDLPAPAIAIASDWPSYGGGPYNAHFSPASQINVGNVAGLKVA